MTSFAKHGYIQDVMPYLLQLLSKANTEITLEEKKQLADMVLNGLVFQLKQDLGQTAVADTLRFCIFLFSRVCLSATWW